MSDSVYQIVTDVILNQLKQGVVPWREHWVSNPDASAYNFSTGKQYSLMNQMLLMRYGPGPYGSFRQWINAGARIKKGMKGNLVVFWKWPDQEDEHSQDEEPPADKPARPILKYYYVFHISQVEGITLESISKPKEYFSEKPILPAVHPPPAALLFPLPRKFLPRQDFPPAGVN